MNIEHEHEHEHELQWTCLADLSKCKHHNLLVLDWSLALPSPLTLDYYSLAAISFSIPRNSFSILGRTSQKSEQVQVATV